MDAGRMGTFALRRRLATQVDGLLGGSAALFGGRAEAGLQLRLLLPVAAYEKPFVLAIPPGGVIVAEPIADQLNAPLEALVVELLRLPGSALPVPLGAIASGARRLLDAAHLGALHVQPWAPGFLAECEQGDLAHLEGLYRDGRMAPDLAGRTAIVVDDGLTPSLGVLAAVDSARAGGATRVILVAPLVPDPVREQLIAAGVEVVRLAGDDEERSGLETALYGEEPPPSDRDALVVLRRAARRVPGAWLRR